MKFDELYNSLINERKHPYEGGTFTSPAEVLSYVDVTDGKVTVKSSKGNPVLASLQYSAEDPNQHVSINWEENGEAYGIDLDKKDDKDYSYEVFEDESGEWIDLEWSPGEKVQLKV